jgi:excinuclease ABC subunit B
VEYFISYYDYYQPEADVPSSDLYIEKDSAINQEIDKLRHSATRSLLERDDVIVVASVSCIYGIGSPEEYYRGRFELKVGMQILIRDLQLLLINRQYKKADGFFERSHYRIQGDICEIFPSDRDDQFLRIEFFEGEIERIQWINERTHVAMDSIAEITLYPGSHYIVEGEVLKRALKTIRQELRERLGELEEQNKHLEAKRLSQRTLLDLELMEEMGFCPGIENYSRHLIGNLPGEPAPTLIDFFGKDFLLIVDESHLTIPQVGGMYAGDRSRKTTLVEHGFRLPSALDNRPLNFQEYESKYHQVLFVSATPADYELEKTHGEYSEQIIRPTGLLDPITEFRDAQNQVKDFLAQAKIVIQRGERVLVTTLTKKLSEELAKYYSTSGLAVSYLHSDIESLERIKILQDLRSGKIDILIGINLLREGLDLPEVSLIGIMDADREGFLRSVRSLIQIIGRAARNSNGRVILYGHSMKKNIEEAMRLTSDRRKKQEDYNREHGITPKTIIKHSSFNILDVLSGKDFSLPDSPLDNAGVIDSPLNWSSSRIDEEIKKHQKLMQEYSTQMRFEDAAKMRDRIKDLNRLRVLI